MQVRSQLTRARILAAARQLLAEQGPSALSHREIARRAETSLGAVTHHFGSKAQLITEMYQAGLQGARQRAIALSTDENQPVSIDALAEGLLSYLKQGVFEAREQALASIEMSLERARSAEARQTLRPLRDESYAFAVQSLADLGSPRPELDAPLLIAVLNGLRMAWLEDGKRSATARAMPELTRRLAAMLVSQWS